MALADDRGVVGIGGEPRIEARHRRRDRRRRRVRLAARNQQIIGRDAGLAGVEQLAGGDARARLLEVAGRVEDRRRLAAELERDRRQIGGGRRRHLPPDGGRAGEQQMIERQRDERLAGLGVADDDADEVGIEIFRRQLGEQRRDARRQLGGFDQRAIRPPPAPRPAGRASTGRDSSTARRCRRRRAAAARGGCAPAGTAARSRRGASASSARDGGARRGSALRVTNNSAMRVSCAARPPKSASTAATRASSLSSISASSRPRRSRRAASGGLGSAAKARRCAAKRSASWGKAGGLAFISFLPARATIDSAIVEATIRAAASASKRFVERRRAGRARPQL